MGRISIVHHRKLKVYRIFAGGTNRPFETHSLQRNVFGFALAIVVFEYNISTSRPHIGSIEMNRQRDIIIPVKLSAEHCAVVIQQEIIRIIEVDIIHFQEVMSDVFHINFQRNLRWIPNPIFTKIPTVRRCSQNWRGNNFDADVVEIKSAIGFNVVEFKSYVFIAALVIFEGEHLLFPGKMIFSREGSQFGKLACWR